MKYFIRTSRVLSGAYYGFFFLGLFFITFFDSDDKLETYGAIIFFVLAWALVWSSVHYIVLNDFYPWARELKPKNGGDLGSD